MLGAISLRCVISSLIPSNCCAGCFLWRCHPDRHSQLLTYVMGVSFFSLRQILLRCVSSSLNQSLRAIHWCWHPDRHGQFRSDGGSYFSFLFAVGILLEVCELLAEPFAAGDLFWRPGCPQVLDKNMRSTYLFRSLRKSSGCPADQKCSKQ